MMMELKKPIRRQSGWPRSYATLLAIVRLELASQLASTEYVPPMVPNKYGGISNAYMLLPCDEVR